MKGLHLWAFSRAISISGVLQASTADADALLHRTVQSVKHMQVLLGCVDVCTLCPDQTQDLKLFWTLRWAYPHCSASEPSHMLD